MPNALIFPMAAHVAWVALLYALLTLARAPDVWGSGRSLDGGNPWSEVEPRISANLSNQFEWPLFFHVACVVLMAQRAGSSIFLLLAWLFVVGRVAHSLVQILSTSLRARGAVFVINFAAVLVMWILLAVRELSRP